MQTVNIHKAKTHLSRLVDQAAKGESFVIAKAGKPMVVVTAVEQAETKLPQRRGFLAGKISLPDDFDTYMQDEIEAMFSGEEEQGQIERQG